MSAQHLVLLSKNLALRRRSAHSTLCEFLFPIIVSGLLLGFFWMIAGVTDPNSDAATFKVEPVPPLDKVETLTSSSDTVDLLYCPQVDGDVASTMKYLEARLPDNVRVKGFTNEASMIKYYQDEYINTWCGISFSLDASQAQTGKFFPSPAEKLVNYSIRYSQSNIPMPESVTTSFKSTTKSPGEDYVSSGFLSLAQEIDTFISQLATGKPNMTRPFTQRFQNTVAPRRLTTGPALVRYSTFRNVVGVFLLIAMLFSFYRLQTDLVTEKTTRIREAMKMMGLKMHAYYTTWFITTLVMISVPMLLVVIIVKYGQVFPECGIFAAWVMILVFVASLINLSFLLAVFVDNPKFAGPIGALVFLGCAAGGIFAATSKLTGATKTTLMLFSPVAFGLANRVIMEQESFGTGLSFSTYSQEHIDISFGTCVAMMVVDTVLYGILAWYCDAVFPGEYGLSHGPLFFIKSSYWKGHAVAENDTTRTGSAVPELSLVAGADDGRNIDAVEQGVERPHTNSDVEEPTLDASTSIRIRSLRKEYGDGTVAVRNLNLDIHEGQILAFLGHNGAGKSTTISVLTGLIPASSGSATVLGHNIMTDMDSVRQKLGVCPQHDVIWDKLTVREHLRLYAGLKGVPQSRIDVDVSDMIMQLNIVQKADAAAGTLSGGQKRKLCVGIALIGGSKVVFLDEPTSGMDPVARRDVWQVLKRNKAGRTIIFTTHFMDEADLLGDRIAILSQGRLRCAGTSLFLKSRFGTGYAITLTKTPKCRTEKVTAFIHKYIENAEMVSDVSAELSFRLPRSAVEHFPHFFAALEDERGDLGVRHFGISLTTLEDVFLRVGMDGEDQEATRLLGAPEIERKSRVRAATNDSIGSDQDAMGSAVTVSATGGSLFARLYALIAIKRIRLALRDIRFLVFQVLFPVLCVFGGLLVLKALRTDPSSAPSLPLGLNLDALGDNATSVWGGVAGSESFVRSMPGYTQADFIETQGSVNQFLIDNPVLSQHTPGAINLTMVNDPNTPEFEFVSLFNPGYTHAIPSYVHELNEAALRTVQNDDSYRIMLHNHPFPAGPFEVAVLNINGAMILGLFMLLGFSVSAAGVASFIVREREEGRKYLQLANGASKPLYWMSTLIADYITYLASALGSIILFASFSYGADAGSGSVLGVSVLLLLYGPAGILFSYLMSFVFTKYSVAQGGITAIQFFFGFFFVSPIISVGIISGPNSFVVRLLNIIFSGLCPSFGLMMGVLKINDFVGMRSGLGKDASLLGTGALLGDHIMVFLIQIVVFLFLVLVIDMRKELSGVFYRSSGQSRYHHDELDPNEEDEDVIEELQRVQGSRAEIVIDGIRQEFPAKWESDGTKVAVRHMSLSIDKGECFGLLGHNGAGKTTLLKILSCSDLPTYGSARIHGHDIHSAPANAQRSIGLCPQFDLLMGKMTGREHLQFYSRLKGLPANKIDATVQSFIDMMDLGKYADKLTQGYSGGNKRKLSLAIALLGNPPVVLLDEPSTGMDPVARRFMWNLISRVSAGRAIILTTHSMEECDNLCTRIGIMKAGALACLGSSQHLKGKFGHGYSLEVKTDTMDNSERVAALLNANLSADLVESHGTLLNYQVSSQDVSLSKVFKLLEDNKTSHGIVDYSVGQPTLEQIFLKLAKQEDEEEPESSGNRHSWGELFRAYFWLLISVLVPGIHHFWMRRWVQGIAYFLTWNVLMFGWLYDLLFMNAYVEAAHRKHGRLGFCCCHPGKLRHHKHVKSIDAVQINDIRIQE